MIDVKTRKKIIKLWGEGENKVSIQKQTGISQSTIRTVLRKAGLDRKSSDRESGSDDSDLEERIEFLEERLEALKHTPLMKNTEPRARETGPMGLTPHTNASETA